MKSKSKSTTYERAIQTIDGFSQVFNIVRQQTAIGVRSDSTFYNYIHRIALVSLHFKRLPEAITDAELTEYLTTLALDAGSPAPPDILIQCTKLRGRLTEFVIPS